MRHRLETAASLAGMGVESWILDGRDPGRLARALAAMAALKAGEEGGDSDRAARLARAMAAMAAKIAFIGVHDERTGTHMADGFARMSGQAGVILAGQNGPGATKRSLSGVTAGSESSQSASSPQPEYPSWS